MIARIRAWMKRRREAWPNAARDIGGTHHPQSRWYRNDEHILAELSGVRVKLDSYTVSTGKSSATYTRVVAPFAFGPGPKMKVAKAGVFSAIGTAIGMDDHPLGDPAFDDQFVVRGSSAAVLRRLWTPSARARMAGALAGVQVTADADEVKLIGGGRWLDSALMGEAMRLVGELAGCDLYGARTLAALGDFIRAPWPRVALDTGVRVEIGAEDRGDTLVMVARAGQPAPAAAPVATAGALPAATLAIENGTPLDALRAAELPQAAHVHLRSIGSGTLEGTTFTWRDLELDPARLRAGAELLGAIAAGGALYR